MKFTVDVDCTPDEARQFLGLPKIAPMQDKAMKEIEKILLENIRNLDPESFVKTWMPLSAQNLGDMQNMFWSQMGGAKPADDKKSG